MKEKSKTVIKREEKVKGFLNALKDACARGDRFEFGTKANAHHLGHPIYNQIRKEVVLSTDASKVFKWNTKEEIDSIAVRIASPKKKTKVSANTPVVLSSPNSTTKKEVAKTTQTAMDFKHIGLHKVIASKCTLTVTVREDMGGTSRSKSYKVDATKFMFDDVDTSIKAFKTKGKIIN